jgi:undecaprenyl phosphate-alpha-L-ara4N flippase subunit ArnF
MAYLLLMISVALTAAAQILFKHGIQRMPREPELLRFLGGALLSPFVMIGMVLFGLGFLIWLVALRDIPVSRAYAFVALGIVLVSLFGHLFLREYVSLRGSIGILLVVTGLVVVATSPS